MENFEIVKALKIDGVLYEVDDYFTFYTDIEFDGVLYENAEVTGKLVSFDDTSFIVNEFGNDTNKLYRFNFNDINI